MANWSPFHVQFHGDDRLLSELFDHWSETVARNVPGYEMTMLGNPFVGDVEQTPGGIFHLDFDNRRFGFRGVGKWKPPLDWLRSLTASLPIACALDYRNPDDNVDHFVLIVKNEIHSFYSVENEQLEAVELRAMAREFVVRLPRPPESRAIRAFEDDCED